MTDGEETCTEIELERKMMACIRDRLPGLAVRGVLVPEEDTAVPVSAVLVSVKPRSQTYDGHPMSVFTAEVGLSVEVAEDPGRSLFARLFSRLQNLFIFLSVLAPELNFPGFSCQSVQLAGGDSGFTDSTDCWTARWTLTVYGVTSPIGGINE